MFTSAELTAVRLGSREDFDEATALYRRVFGYQGEEFAINPLLMRGIVANGGTAVGVRTPDGALVGFAYGFPGYTEGNVYQYSQAAVIEPGFQGHGIGRRLKLAQREVALENGMDRMRWAYDPFYARNGHFNLDALGAVGLWFRPSFYGTPGSDRIIVEWDLTRGTEHAVGYPPELVPSFSKQQWGTAVTDGDAVWVPLPGNVTVDVKEYSPELARVRSVFMASFARLFEEGYLLRHCARVDAETSAYRLERA